ncbi:hypothetical protein LOTGIDRAFT_158444 [Lottia gigantea]|uniref:Plexin cytoplasmic RasGAP domain-containing protein n=1 Tax=Lottia gigantea TaxID=225164 RepID=V4AQ85_LOTGI|nr:hypothetical protein LOTGIDRAFT_158444 [Lottia gigantea]ESO99357.1 hypothetical protein LOTGIDRAFT_158444 [Lottia gigantea]
MSELNFDRLLKTKVNLKEYIDNILKNIFDIHDIPVPVRHLFHLLETCGLRNGFDKTVIESWKINSYFIKYWSKILSQPEVLYDLNESSEPHIQTNMNVIVLAFIDIFSPPQTLGKKSPTLKLLFYKDCYEYRKSKVTFFKSGATVAGVKSADLTSELGKLPYLIDTIPFNRRSMLYKLFLVIDNYDDKIIKDLDETDETRRLKLSDKLDEVFETMRNT